MTAVKDRPAATRIPEVIVAECGHYRLAQAGVPFGEHYTSVGAAIAALGRLETAVAS